MYSCMKPDLILLLVIAQKEVISQALSVTQSTLHILQQSSNTNGPGASAAAGSSSRSDGRRSDRSVEQQQSPFELKRSHSPPFNNERYPSGEPGPKKMKRDFEIPGMHNQMSSGAEGASYRKLFPERTRSTDGNLVPVPLLHMPDARPPHFASTGNKPAPLLSHHQGAPGAPDQYDQDEDFPDNENMFPDQQG